MHADDEIWLDERIAMRMMVVWGRDSKLREVLHRQYQSQHSFGLLLRSGSMQ
jgi:hypothetical protein